MSSQLFFSSYKYIELRRISSTHPIHQRPLSTFYQSALSKGKSRFSWRAYVSRNQTSRVVAQRKSSQSDRGVVRPKRTERQTFFHGTSIIINVKSARQRRISVYRKRGREREREEMRQIKQAVYGADGFAEGVECFMERGKARKRR